MLFKFLHFLTNQDLGGHHGRLFLRCPSRIGDTVTTDSLGRNSTGTVDRRRERHRRCTGLCPSRAAHRHGTQFRLHQNHREVIPYLLLTTISNCSEIALKLLWNCTEIALKLLWNAIELIHFLWVFFFPFRLLFWRAEEGEKLTKNRTKRGEKKIRRFCGLS